MKDAESVKYALYCMYQELLKYKDKSFYKKYFENLANYSGKILKSVL